MTLNYRLPVNRQLPTPNSQLPTPGSQAAPTAKFQIPTAKLPNRQSRWSFHATFAILLEQYVFSMAA